MFRRLPAGLPEDPTFPVGLDALGYYINEIDEVRHKENSKAYFHYFLYNNERYNEVQREAMNESLRQIITSRLANLGMEKIRLPLGAGPHDRHVPILVSADLATARRVIVIFHDTANDLGVFANRIVGGPQGVDAGSAVALVRHVRAAHAAGPDDARAPAIVLANAGQLHWHRRSRRALTKTSWAALPRRSAVDAPFRVDETRNTVSGHRDAAEHVASVLDDVVAALAGPDATIDVVGVTHTGNYVVEYLDKPENFAKLGPRIGGIALLQPYYWPEQVKNTDLIELLKRRGRSFLAAQEVEAGKVVCGPYGMKDQCGFFAPLYSLGETALHEECLLPLRHALVTDWLHEVAMGGRAYANPTDYEFGGEPVVGEGADAEH